MSSPIRHRLRLPHSWIRLAIVLLLVLSIPLIRLAFAGTANFQNGNFASNTVGGSTGKKIFTAVDSTDLTGWSIFSGSVALAGSSIWTSSSGSYSVDLDGNSPGGIAQAFATVVGQTYTMAFDLSGNPLCNGSSSSGTGGNGETKSLLVNIFDVSSGNLFSSQTYTFSTASNTTSKMGWVTKSVSFTATGGSTEIALASQDLASSRCGPVVANFHLYSTIAGTVYEDINYGGGAGRDKAQSSAGSARPNARVELYSSTGAFLGATTTSGVGAYSLQVDTNSTYTLRVVNATVVSARAGATTALIPVQTFRTNAASGSVVEVTDHVGGENPSLVDAGSNTTSANLSSLTSATATPQSITTVSVGNSAISGLDFGFNFDTIVNTNASGQGSLVQWATNAATFTDQSSLAQAGSRTIGGVTSALPAGYETSIFMISAGTAVGGLRSALASQLASGYASIVPSTGSISLSQANVILDGATQTANVGNTNSGSIGTGGTVGTAAVALARFDMPEVQIAMANGNTLCASAANDAIRALSVYAGSICVNGNYDQVSDVLVGMDAQGNSNAATLETNNYGITVGGASNVTINHNYIKVDNTGVRRDVAGANLTVQYNEIAVPYNGQNATYDGVIVWPGSGDLVQYNLIRNQVGSGIEMYIGGGTNYLVQQNTLSANGLNYGTATASTEPAAIVICGSIAAPRPQVTIAQNVITGSGADGISVQTGSGFKITQNAIYGNAVGTSNGIGIDLATNGTVNCNAFAPSGVMANTGSLNAALPNNGMNAPVFTSAGVTGSTLGVVGYVGTAASHAAFANATVEIFQANPNPSGAGDGQTYLGTLTADANGNFSGTLTVPSGVTVTIGSVLTATATDASGDTSEFGPNFTVNSAYSLAPGSFNAFESTTAAGAITGVIQTKIAGAAFGLDIVAVNTAGTGVDASFTGTVTVQLLDASNNSGALVNTCRSTWVAIGSAGTATFASSNGGRLSTTFNSANAYPNARVQISYTPSTGSTVVSCSSDNFAIRPSTLALLAATDASWTTYGTARALGNITASGGNVHKAGQPFTLSAQAQNAVGALTANYSGTTTAILTCVLPAGCGAANLGSLTFTPTVTAGVMASNDAVYSDVGSFTLQLVDTTFAAVDAADSTPAQRYIYSAAVNVGRFVPDHFALSVATQGTLYTYGSGTCATRSFTYQGQAVGYATLPVVGVTAQNASNGTTANYKNELWKLTSSSVAQTYSDSGGHAVAATPGAATVTSGGNGTGTLSPNSGDTVTWVRSATTPSAPFAAQAVDTFGVVDSSESSGSITQAATVSANPAFDSGSNMVFGRIALTNAYGVETQSLAVPAETQYYTGSVWVTNSSDACTVIPGPALAFGNWQLNLNACATSVSGGGTVSRGRTSLVLSAPGPAGTGSVDLTLNLGAVASGSACIGGAAQASTTAGLAFLQGAWGGAAYSVNPTARASFGEYGVMPGFRREN